MGGWRRKLIFVLIVYFAGFATAIYTLVPVPEDYSSADGKRSISHSALKSDQFAQSFNVGLHKCIDFAKVAAKDLGAFLKEKLNDVNRDSG